MDCLAVVSEGVLGVSTRVQVGRVEGVLPGELHLRPEMRGGVGRELSRGWGGGGTSEGLFVLCCATGFGLDPISRLFSAMLSQAEKPTAFL